MLSTINRGIALIIPKQPFYHWANSLEDELDIRAEDETEYRSFLIQDEWEGFDPYLVIEPYMDTIFEEMCFGMLTDPAHWPKKRDMVTFKNFFDIKLSSLVMDLVDEEPILRDDELDERDIDTQILNDFINAVGKKTKKKQ